MSDFEKEYNRLNSNQRQAVELIEGPVLVIAGPGTGKTQLLAMRVANILMKTDTDAKNILSLTFTNKAAVNMKNRIIGLTGGEGAQSIVKTFHSFAAEIMNSYPDYFWNSAPLSVAPDSVQLDIIESIVKQLPLDNPLALKFSGQYTLVNDIRNGINLVKEAGLTPESLEKVIGSNLEYLEKIEQDLVDIFSPRLSKKNLTKLTDKLVFLPDQEDIEGFFYPLRPLKEVLIEKIESAVKNDMELGSTSNTSNLKKQIIQKIDGEYKAHQEHKKNEWWLNLSNVYTIYREEMHSRGFYDYSDMLVEVLKQLEAHPEMLADVQERFLYVLIDEFQDTNPAQLRFAQLIADHHTSENKPNIMAVGDDDQSIYKFNGAELNNMMSFKRRYPEGNIIVLTKNYRSSQAILDQSKKIIELVDNRLINKFSGLDKTLSAVNAPKDSTIIKAEEFTSREQQLSAVARMVEKSYPKGKSIAVLARNHDSLIKMSSLLLQLGVPVKYEQQTNILQHEIVEQTYLVIKLLSAMQAGDELLTNSLIHKIIRHPLWGVDPHSLWLLAKDNLFKPHWVESMKRDEHMAPLADWFLWLSQDSARQPLAVTLEYVLGLRGSKNFTSPMKTYFLNSKKGAGTYFHGLSAIQLLRSLVNEFSKSSQPSVDDLVRFFEINMDNKRIIADESPFISGRDAVQLLTIHKAKGLEFDNVYIVDVIEKNWQPRKGSRKPPMNLPLQPNGDDADDYVRLMYVAATRAKESLYLSGYSQDHAGTDVSLSPIMLSSFDVKQAPGIPQNKLIEILEHHLHWPDLSKASEKEIIKSRLETYNLSVTDLMNFLDLESAGPKYFKEKNLLRLPEPKTPSLAHGTAIHGAMEYAQILANKNKFGVDKIIGHYKKTLENEHLSVAEHQRFIKLGEETLNRLFGEFKYKLVKGNAPEKKLRDVTLNNARISGKLDRIDFYNDRIEVIDYKTGKGIGNIHTKDKSKQTKAWKYKTQLCFYNILLRNSGMLNKDKNYAGKMVFVETDEQKYLEQTYQPSKDELDHLSRLIESVWNKIINLDLPNTDSYAPDYEGILKFQEDLINGKV